MSRADIERFVADLKSDPALLGQIQAGATGLASVVDMAKAKGYDVSIDEAKAYIDEQAKQELSDDQLDAVAGGKGSVQANTNVQVNVEALSNAVAVTNGVGVSNVGGVVEAVAVAAIVLT